MLLVRHMLGALDGDNMVKALGLKAVVEPIPPQKADLRAAGGPLGCSLCLDGRDGEAGYMDAVLLGQPLGGRPIPAADVTHVLPRIES